MGFTLSRVIAPAIAFLLLAVAFVPVSAVGQDNSGGSVNNVTSETESLDNSAGTEADAGITDVITAVVKDKNGKKDIRTVVIELDPSSPENFTVEINQSQLADAPDAEPTNFTASGWKIWKTGNSKIHVKVEYFYDEGSPGDYKWKVSAKDETDFDVSKIKEKIVKVRNKVKTYADPVGFDGTPQENALFGGWAALPSQTNVTSNNVIRVDNVGHKTDRAFDLDFTGASFAGQSDADFQIDINNNLEFAYVEMATPAGAPTLSPGDFTNWQSAVSGGQTFAFTDTGNSLFVQYRLVALPDVLADQDYVATYTLAIQ